MFGAQAYVQQLESSRMKLTQLEQELQRARQQVPFWAPSLPPLYNYAVPVKIFLLFQFTEFSFLCWRVYLFQVQEIKLSLLVEMVCMIMLF